MADQVVDNLLVDIKIRMSALEQGLAAAGDRIDQFTGKTIDAAKQQAAAVKASARDQKEAYTIIGAAATAAFVVIVSAIKTGITTANQYTSALTGLRSVAQGAKQDFSSLQGALKDLTADGLIPVSDAATAVKNLLARGFDAQESIAILTRLKDSAAFGRQASLTIGEAVRSATEGLKNENSILVDNAGVTKNVSVMWAEYAKQIGKGVDSLTTAEKCQAEYNGIIHETRFQVGDAEKYAATFAGTQAELGAVTLKTEQAFGSAMQNGLKPFAQILTSAVSGVEKFVGKNPALTAGLTAVATVAVLATAGLAAVTLAAEKLTLVITTLKASMGWIGIAAGIAGAVFALVAATENAAQETANYTQTLQDNIAAAQQEGAAIRNYQDLVQSGSASTEQLIAARQKIADQSPQLVTGYDAEGSAIIATNDALDAHVKQLDATIAKEKELILLRANETIAAAQKNIESLKSERDEQEKLYAQKETDYKAYAAAVEEGQKQFDAAVASGNQQKIQSAGMTLNQAKLNMGAASKAMADSITEMRRLDGEINKNQGDIAKTRTVQYEQEVQSLGTLTAAQQYLVNQEMQRAQAEGLTAEQFKTNAAAALIDLDRLSGAQEKLNQSALAGAGAAKDWADQEKNLQSIQKANTAVVDAQKMRDYVKVIKEGKEGTKEYSDAKAALVKAFGGEEKSVKANIAGYEALADQGLAGAIDAQGKLRASLQAAISELTNTKGATDQTVVALQTLLTYFNLLGGTTTTSSGGGGSAKKKPWEEELDMIDRVKDNEGEYVQVYLDHIDELLQNEKLSSKERQRLEKERQYAVLQVNNELEQANVAYLERLLQREKLTAEQRLDVEKRLYEARKSMMEQFDSFADAITGAITASVEAQRDAEISSIQDSLSAVGEWQQAQTDAIRAVADARIKTINEQIAALDALSKAQDRADKDAEGADKLQRLQAQLAYEKDGQNKQKLQEQIAALEASTTKRHDQEKLDDQKQALKDQITAINDSVDAQTKAIEAQAKAETNALNARLKAAQDYWAARLTAESIQQQALAFLNEKTQDEILALLEKYAPDYLQKGKLLGSQLYGGLKPKIDAVLDEIARLRSEAQKPITITVTTVYKSVYESGSSGSSKTTANTAGVQRIVDGIQAFAASPGTSIAGMYDRAQRAMDGMLYRSMQPAALAAQAAVAGSRGASTGQPRSLKVEQTVIMQQPVPSPSQNARALRRESERLADMLGRR